MRQGTTPIASLTIDVERNEDGTIVPSSTLDGSNVYVTLDQNGTQITKSSRGSEDIEITKNYDEQTGEFKSSSVAMYLTQQETLGLEVGKARTQIRWVDFVGDAFATDIGTIDIEESLLEEVIEYGN